MGSYRSGQRGDVTDDEEVDVEVTGALVEEVRQLYEELIGELKTSVHESAVATAASWASSTGTKHKATVSNRDVAGSAEVDVVKQVLSRCT